MARAPAHEPLAHSREPLCQRLRRLSPSRASTKAFVLLDSTLLPIDRIAADCPFCSVKSSKRRMNVQALADRPGRLL